MKRTRIISLLLTLALTAALLVTPAAAAGAAPRLTVSSQEAQNSQTVGFTGLPADCQSIQVTLHLSDETATYLFTPDTALGRPGIHTTAKQDGGAVTIYVTAKSGVLTENGSLTLGELSAGDKTFTVDSASDLKLLDEASAEETYPTVEEGEESIVGPGVTSSWAIDVSKVSGGQLTVSASRAGKGETITVTAKADSGYVLDKVEVTSAAGSTITLKDKGNGQFTFTMPASKVTVSAVFAAQDSAVPFADVSPSAWYYQAVEYVYGAGLMTGVDGASFAPNVTTTRGMLMTILARMDGVDTTGSDPWYAKGMEWAVAQGVSDGTNPQGTITREQLAAMLYRYSGSPAVDGGALNFTDADKVSAWASDAVKWAVAGGVISGKGNNMLDPQGNATRAEVAQMLYNFSKIG